MENRERERERERELLYDWRFTANQFVFVTKPLETHGKNFFN
jgi:hypothetical protein